VATVGKIETEDTVVGVEDSGVSVEVCRRTGEGLDIVLAGDDESQNESTHAGR
jgi:hypothetical protein